jgi:hypothetical protein
LETNLKILIRTHELLEAAKEFSKLIFYKCWAIQGAADPKFCFRKLGSDAGVIISVNSSRKFYNYDKKYTYNRDMFRHDHTVKLAVNANVKRRQISL